MPRPPRWPTNPPRLPTHGLKGRDGREYIASSDLVVAANVALACGMPLLITGEPGCGKTDFAHAAAGALAAQAQVDPDQVLRDYPIRSDTRARDLLYSYDAVRRFSDAQLRGRAGMEKIPGDHPAEYIHLEALGRALQAKYQTVVLLDEVDKAPRDLPNDVLNEFERMEFTIDELETPRHARRRFTVGY